MIIYHPLLGSYMYLIRPVELVYFSNNILCAKITRMLVFGSFSDFRWPIFGG